MVSSGDVPLDFNLASFFVSPIFEFFNTIGAQRKLSRAVVCFRLWPRSRPPWGMHRCAPLAAQSTFGNGAIQKSRSTPKPKPVKSAPISCFAGLPILNPAFYPRDHCARPDFAVHDQRKGSEEI
jgi:hypothetical protein